MCTVLFPSLPPPAAGRWGARRRGPCGVTNMQRLAARVAASYGLGLCNRRVMSLAASSQDARGSAWSSRRRGLRWGAACASDAQLFYLFQWVLRGEVCRSLLLGSEGAGIVFCWQLAGAGDALRLRDGGTVLCFLDRPSSATIIIEKLRARQAPAAVPEVSGKAVAAAAAAPRCLLLRSGLLDQLRRACRWRPEQRRDCSMQAPSYNIGRRRRRRERAEEAAPAARGVCCWQRRRESGRRAARAARQQQEPAEAAAAALTSCQPHQTANPPGSSRQQATKRASLTFLPALRRLAGGLAAMNIATWLLIAYFAMLGNTLWGLFFPPTCGVMEAAELCVHPHIADGERSVCASLKD